MALVSTLKPLGFRHPATSKEPLQFQRECKYEITASLGIERCLVLRGKMPDLLAGAGREGGGREGGWREGEGGG